MCSVCMLAWSSCHFFSPLIFPLDVSASVCKPHKALLCPGVPVHRGNNHCTPLFMNLCLAVEHCWVFCIGSCEPVHEDRTQNLLWSYSIERYFEIFWRYIYIVIEIVFARKALPMYNLKQRYSSISCMKPFISIKRDTRLQYKWNIVVN